MPVDNTYDIAKEANRISVGHRAGCFNRALRPSNGYWVAEREYRPDGTYYYKHTFVAHRMTDKCRQILPLAECEGCTTPKDQYEIVDGSVRWL